MKSRLLCVLAILAVFALALAACGTGQQVEVEDGAAVEEAGEVEAVEEPAAETEEEGAVEEPAAETEEEAATEEPAAEGEATAETVAEEVEVDPGTQEEDAEVLGEMAEAQISDTPETVLEAGLDQCEGGPFTIGVSNGFVGSEWRTQMLQNMQAANEVYMEAGLTEELVVESADVDIQGQIQQIQNLVNRGVDAIIVNPNSQDALNTAFQDAVDQGVTVIAVDQEVSAEGVYNVVIDQQEWATISARWLAEELGGEGDIVIIEGLVGHPGNEHRMEGVEEVLSEYPDINVVGRQAGNWDQATGQQVMSDFLASLPNIDGLWTQDGMATGALQAIITADPDPWPIVTGEARASYLQLWDEVRSTINPDFTTIGVVNPPGVGVSAMRVAMELLCGEQVDESQLAGPFGNSLYVPIPFVVDESNFDQMIEQYGDAPASYTLDGWISQEEADAFMQ